MKAARAAGCLVGIAAAIALLAVNRPAMGERVAGAEVIVSAGQTGELAVSPAAPEPLIRAAALHPGDESGASTVTITNQTGQVQWVRVGGRASEPSLDRALTLRVSGPGGALASGALADLGTPGGAPLVLSPGESAVVTASISLAAEAPEGWQAARVEVSLVFAARAAHAGSQGTR